MVGKARLQDKGLHTEYKEVFYGFASKQARGANAVADTRFAAGR